MTTDFKTLEQAIMQRMQADYVPAVGLSIVKNGQTVYAGTLGQAKNDALFQVASLSKTFNALGAMVMVQQGRLSLDTNINEYLVKWKVPQHNWSNQNVTLRRLLSHTAGINVSGFPGYPQGSTIPNTAAVLRGEKSLVNTDPIRVIAEPGKDYLYSGGGSTIVQCVIEDVTGEGYNDWMTENVLRPLGMSGSTFHQSPEPEKVAYAHEKDGTVIEGGWHIYPEAGAAGLWTTAADMGHFIAHVSDMFYDKPNTLLNGDLLGEMIMPEFTTADENSFAGLGFFLGRSNEKFYFRNAGANRGYSSVFAIYPAQKSGFAILTNRHDAFAVIDRIAADIAKTYDFPLTSFDD